MCCATASISVPVPAVSDKKSLQSLKPSTGVVAVLKKVFPAPMMCPSPVRNCAVRVYMQCSNGLDFVQFIEDFKMSDTFDSYFKAVILHVWISMLRLSNEPVEYYVPMRDFIIELLWKEMDDKVKELKSFTFPKQKTRFFAEMYQILVESFLDFDEGLLGNDMVLAAALWRRMYNARADVDIEILHRMVYYVRAQVYRQAQIPTEELLRTGIQGWSLAEVTKLSATTSAAKKLYASPN